MNTQQQYIYDKIKEAVVVASAQDNMELYEVAEPIIRYIVTVFAIAKGYDSIDNEQIQELEQEYYTQEKPNYISAVLLQSLNILTMTDTVRATKEKP